MTKPRPTPLVFIYLLSWTIPKSWNKFFWFFLEIPIPVSYTLICSISFSFFITTSTIIFTLPSLVNLRALLYKPRSTYMTRCLSVLIMGPCLWRLPSSCLMFTNYTSCWMLLSWAFLYCIIITSFTMVTTLKFEIFFRNFPAFIWAKSRRSCTMWVRMLAEDSWMMNPFFN